MIESDANKYYNKLRKEYTDEGIAESCIFSIDMSEDEQKELKKAIDKRRRKLTDIEREEVIRFLRKENICRIR